MRLRSTFRVASPLVMATRATRARHAAVHLGRRACSQIKPLPPASQEVVPHETASELGINLSGFAALRLRQGNSAQTTHLSPRNFKLAIHSEGRRPERASCEAGCERSTTWRSPLRRLPLVYPTRKRAKAADAARTFGVMHAKASESGHLKRSFSSPLSRERSNTSLNPRRSPRRRSRGLRARPSNAPRVPRVSGACAR